MKIPLMIGGATTWCIPSKLRLNTETVIHVNDASRAVTVAGIY
jgi:cobalamin-dependent methionine synthase I